jgi:hypothetical protein
VLEPEESGELPPIQAEPLPPPEPKDPDRTYWADLDIEDIGDAIACRVKDFYGGLSGLGMLDLWAAAHHAFYSLSENGSHEASKVIEFGDNGEMLGVRSNQARSIIRYILTSATADRPAWQPRATSPRADALSQISTARQLLEYYFTKKGFEKALVSAALRSLIYGKSYIWETWDVNAGPTDPQTGKPMGDVGVLTLSPADVVCDLEREPGDHDWFIIKRYRNKYDLAAQYAPDTSPELAELRERLIGLDENGLEAEIQLKAKLNLTSLTRKTDDVPVWHLLHAKTAARPEGRYTIMCGSDEVLFDGPLPFDELHVYDMTPEEFLEAGNLGYGAIWEIMGLQQVYDGMLSTAVSNFDAMGTNDVLLADGVNLGYEEIRDGLNVIRHPAGQAPAVLEKFQLGDPFFKLFTAIRENMQLALGVNNVVRGDPEASLKSGSALALIQAQAVHFQSGFQGTYVRLQEKVGTGLIKLLKKFAEAPRLAAIVGPYESDALKAFKASDIAEIDRVDVEVGNPIYRTVAGKFDIATQLLDKGLIKDVNQYYQVLETGRLEPVSDPARKAALLVRQENELLMQGPAVTPSIDQMTGMPKLDPMTGQPIMQVEGVPVAITHDPTAHIAGHADVLNSPDALANPAVVSAVTEHIMEHMRLWKAADPELMLLLGFPVAGMQTGQPEEEGGTGGDPNKGGNDAKKEAAKKPTGGNAPADGAAAKLPRPAKPPPEAEV